MTKRSRPYIAMEQTAGVSTMLSDEEIIRRVLEGEKELYEIIMRRYNQRLFRICRAYVHDDDEAEDILQETHVKAYQALPRFEKRSQFTTWLTRILINESLGRIKHQKRFERIQHAARDAGGEKIPREFQSPTTDNPLARAMNSELQNILEHAIDELPEKYRVVYTMREIEGLSVVETGRCLNISEGNVKVRLNRAKEMLRQSIGSTYGSALVYHFDLVRCDRIVSNVMKRITRY